MDILEWFTCRNKSGPFPLINAATYWKISNFEASAKNLSQILAVGRGLVSEFL